jgi:integrase
MMWLAWTISSQSQFADPSTGDRQDRTSQACALPRSLEMTASDQTGDRSGANFHPLVAGYLAAALAPNTRRAYGFDLADFEVWGGHIPCSPEAVARYLAESAAILKPCTLRRRLAALAGAHHDLGAEDPTKHPLVRRVMHGIERTHGTAPRQAMPLLVQDPKRIIASLGDTPIDVRDRTLLLVGFFGALRRSELVTLTVENIDVTDKGVRLFIPKSKTDQTGKGRVVRLQLREDTLCPVEALKEWLRRRSVSEGYVFARPGSSVSSSVGHLTGDAVSLIVKRRVFAIGLDPARYSGHSMRAGFATSAALAGIDATLIARQTGHRSQQMVATYVRPDIGIDARGSQGRF